jgi:hypothetical protein
MTYGQDKDSDESEKTDHDLNESPTRRSVRFVSTGEVDMKATPNARNSTSYMAGREPLTPVESGEGLHNSEVNRPPVAAKEKAQPARAVHNLQPVVDQELDEQLQQNIQSNIDAFQEASVNRARVNSSRIQKTPHISSVCTSLITHFEPSNNHK